MTTIAFKDGILAADSRAMCNHWVAHDSAMKIFEETHPVHGRMLFAIAGDYVEGRHAVQAIFAKKKYVPQHSETGFTVLGVTPQGQLRQWVVGETHTDGEAVLAPFYAIGSGRVPAMAAMHAGATAIEAVEIAKKLDPSTGGEVRGYAITKTFMPLKKDVF
jgi:hypothetical protein